MPFVEIKLMNAMYDMEQRLKRGLLGAPDEMQRTIRNLEKLKKYLPRVSFGLLLGCAVVAMLGHIHAIWILIIWWCNCLFWEVAVLPYWSCSGSLLSNTRHTFCTLISIVNLYYLKKKEPCWSVWNSSPDRSRCEKALEENAKKKKKVLPNKIELIWSRT